MREGKPGHDISSLSEAEREKQAAREIAMLAEAKKTPKKQRFAEGTAPDAVRANEELQQAKSILSKDAEDDFSDKEVTKEYKKQVEQPGSLEDDVLGITEGLNKASQQIAGEKRAKNEAKFAQAGSERKAAAEAKVRAVIDAEKEDREWEAQMALAKQKIAVEGDRPRVVEKGKMAGPETKAKIDAKLKADEEVRQKNDEEAWESKEWDTKIKTAKEEAVVAQEWEEKEWAAKTKIAKEKSFWAALKEKIGFGKKREKR